MVSTFTPNVQIEEPARGDDVGTWDTPVNNNSTLIDLVAGGTAAISVSNANITLSAAQFRCATLIFNGTQTTNIVITFPTSFTKPYTVFNNTANFSNVITLSTTAAGAEAICCPPGEYIDCVNDGTNMRFRNLGRVGEYMDLAITSVPQWIASCTKPPYLQCNGTSFSSATYPALTVFLNSTTLPDSRGRFRATVDPGLSRITTAGCGLNGGQLFAGGGDQLPQAHNHTASDAGHTHGSNANQEPSQGTLTGGSGFGVGTVPLAGLATINSGQAIITVSTVFSGAGGNVPPAYIGGITFIRAG